MTKDQEKEIIAGILAGNTESFCLLVDRYKDAAFTLSVRLVGNRDDAADICQDSFVKAFHSLKQFRGDAGFATWLYRIVYNASISHIRKNKMRALPVGEGRMPEIPDYDADKAWEEEETELKKTLVRQCLDELPELDRSLLTLFYLMEHSVAEIASITDLSESNVKVRLHRARTRLYGQVTSRLRVAII